MPITDNSTATGCTRGIRDEFRRGMRTGNRGLAKIRVLNKCIEGTDLTRDCGTTSTQIVHTIIGEFPGAYSSGGLEAQATRSHSFCFIP